MDENDWSPKWESVHYDGFVYDSSEIGTPVLRLQRKAEPLTVKAIDKDSTANGLVRYSFLGKDSSKYFSIDHLTGK